MRHHAALFAALLLAACGAAAGTGGGSDAANPAQAPASEPQQASRDSVVQFLLTSAATDFHAHRPPDPVRFRDVRFGHVITASGEKQYMLCGQFLPAKEGGTAEWMLFATIKTSGYEQWIGAQGEAVCRRSVVWEDVGDLSAALQRRLDALR